MQENYLSQWGQVLLFIVAGFLFASIALLVSRLLRPNRPNPEKLATYESGENAIGSPWVQFDLKFYVLALVFILFEIEVVFIFPWTTVFADADLISATDGRWGWYAFAEMIIFIAVLALGLAYAWVKGHLNWMRSEQQTQDFKSPVPKVLYDKINERYR